ncbi:protein FAR1-RELATED SEQUENCE 7 isoform X2 [Dendrobium catenatum]|uniref:Protein FAR1-RELATED SEQUENCE 5 n=1 Tax=Dendrobium catenatum TaxID=906689 RepID=A0A2I0VR03_9ASPA|nr:protein FAR1-RELATED SEQUENCE 7 isoform X2 [Dendrobium catenatum]PKU65844.1 Protein FAR1-RELATED SEQUENCE 5 [Dendrobium catenatum]
MFRISEPSEVPSSNQEKVEEDVEMEVKDEEALARAEEALVGQPPDEQALRVAQIVRSYLHMKQTAEGGEGGCGDAESPSGDRCKAMMEVVLKENGKWSISKLETEHNHSLNAASSGDGSTKVALTIGMVFDSVEEAKAFYYGYGEKIGFRARTGSNRRSVGKGALIMQRFLCWRGSYPLQRRNLETSTGKRKRGPYKKRSKLLDEFEEKKDGDGDVVEVVDIDSSAEKIGMADADFGVYVESRPSVKGSVGGDCAAEIESRALVKSTASSETTKAPASEMKNGGQPPATSVSAQSKLLRELGVRVYRYSSDEKRDIILRYLMKKNNRQSGERTIKFFTTQPPPGENFLQQQNIQQQQNIPQQQDAGGKFIGWVPLQTYEMQDKVVARKPKPLIREITGVVEEPKIGMLFANEDRAYEFYLRYAGNVGFCVRKGWWDKTARSVTRLRVYVCSKEGFRPKSFANEMKKARPETRTGCPARMAIKLMSNGKYSVSEFVSEHNHDLAAPLDIQMFKSQKLLTKMQFGNHHRTKLIPSEYKNYLRLKRARSMPMGDAGAMLTYLQRMKSENPSFFYAIQVDEDDQLTNIFWADTNSIMDYDYFGDVVCFNTTYKDADSGRPFVLFTGVNHHKQTVIFGAAVMYAETVESFKWLFETFKAVMGGKQPKTILTGQSSAISDAIAVVWPSVVHRYCIWHIYQSVAKNLTQDFKDLENFLLDFNQCIFEFQEEEDFLTAWTSLLERYGLKDNEWLANLYEERKKWALPYGQETFYADIFNTLRRDGLNSVLKEYLSPEIDLLQFLNKYEEFVKERRYMEQEADYLSSQCVSRATTLRFLWQAANVYTHAAFEMFKMEFDLLSNCIVYGCGDVGTVSEYEGTVSEYEVAVKDKSKLYFVRFDISDGSVFCSCKKFEFVGIQCCHVLRVLDCRNVKELAPQYFLKRWSKDVKSGLIRDNEGFTLQDDPKSSLQKRYSSLCRILYRIAARAAQNVHAYAFMENQSNQILEQVEQILQTKLLEKTSMNNFSKGQSQSQIQGEGIDNENNGESRRSSGKKKNDATVRRRQQNGMDMSKQYKGLTGKSDAVEVSMDANDPLMASNEIPSQTRNSSNQIFPPSQSFQGPYIPGHQFGLGSFHGFHGTPQFTQEFSAPVLQQQSFPGETHLGQASEMHALQFVASNSQLGPQGGDQGHYTIPVWDFL